MVSKIARLELTSHIVKILIKLKSFIVDRVLSSFRFRALIRQSGERSYCHYSVEIKYGENITIGQNTRIGPECTLGGYNKITVGDSVVISKGVFIETAGLDFKTNTRPYKHKGEEIVIHDNVWVGARAIILGGVSIGENSIIGAGAIVTKDVPENTIVVGQAPRTIHIRH